MNVKTLNEIINPKNIKRSDIERAVLEKADFRTDPMNGEKYFDLVYRCCAKNGLEWIVEFPRVINAFPVDAFPVIRVEYLHSSSCANGFIALDEAQLLPGETAYIDTPGWTPAASYIVNEPAKEMTLAEVEEKLGYKVKIISEKENNNE